MEGRGWEKTMMVKAHRLLEVCILACSDVRWQLSSPWEEGHILYPCHTAPPVFKELFSWKFWALRLRGREEEAEKCLRGKLLSHFQNIYLELAESCP